MKNAILYTRVSDISQVKYGHSIEEQEPMLREFASKQGYKVVRVFTDKAKSATSTVKRDELMNALGFIEQNKTIDALIVQDTDRLARNEYDHHLIKSFLRKHKVGLLSMNQPGIDDSPEGQFMDTVLAGVNAFQSRLTGRKVANITSRMAEQGKTPNQAPIGYINVTIDSAERYQKGVQLHPEISKHIKTAFELYSSGNYTLRDIALYLNEKGVKTLQQNEFCASSMQYIFSNPYYTGKIRRKENLYKGQHPQLISDNLFETCKEMLSKKRNFATRKRNPENHKRFYLRSFLRCGVCGYLMSGESTTGRSKEKYHYFRCIRPKSDPKYHSNAGESTPLIVIESAVEGYFSSIRLSPTLIEEILQRAKEILSETHSDIDIEKKSLRKEMSHLETQRQNLEIKLLDGVIDDDAFTRNHSRINEVIRKINSRLAEIEDIREDNITIFDGFVKLARNLSKAYKKANPELKKVYLSIFWDRFEIKNREISKVVPSKVVSALIRENLITFSNNKRKGFLINKNWLPRLDSNQ